MKRTAISTFMMVACLGLAACDSNDGPLEKLGESADEAINDAGDQLEDAADEIERKLD
ncbi:MAG: hypothetical protein H6978_11585 [Gammaproteobacteria bacterium]|nr:hypothetical protein [Gammaproteobacteria bacterium]